MAGGQRICLELVRDALKAGDRVSIASPSRGAFTEACVGQARVDVLPFWTLRDLRRLPTFVRYLRALAPDLVHTHTTVPANILWRLASRLARVPVVSHMHIENYFGQRLMKARVVRRVDTATAHIPVRHIAVSDHTARTLVAQGYPEKRMVVVRNGLAWQETAVNDGRVAERARPIVGCVGRLCDSKGQATLIRVFPRVLDKVPDAVAWIVGKDQQTGGAYEDELRRLASSLGLGDHVVFLGHRDDVLALIDEMAIVVLPSKDEGLPLVLVEALSRGVPVVATAVAGIPELVRDGEEGYLIRAGDDEALVDRIVRLLSQPRVAGDMGLRGRARVREHFTRESMLGGVRAIYAEVLEGRGRATDS